MFMMINRIEILILVCIEIICIIFYLYLFCFLFFICLFLKSVHDAIELLNLDAGCISFIFAFCFVCFCFFERVFMMP